MLQQNYNGLTYSAAAISGIIAAGAAANAEILQFRWTAAPANARIMSVILSAYVDATAFTAGVADFQLRRATAWTVDGTGGTALTMTGANAALSTLQAPSRGAGIRVATTAALGAGTKVQEATSHAGVVGSGSATAGGLILASANLLNPTAYGELPLILRQNEGFSILANVPATGTWRYSAHIVWAELA